MTKQTRFRFSLATMLLAVAWSAVVVWLNTLDEPNKIGVAGRLRRYWVGRIAAVMLLVVLSSAAVSAEDLTTLKDRASGGDPDAQIRLGIAYRDGRGVARDDAQALAWFRKAAEKNNAAAFDNLGWMCEHGLGTTADLAEAARYYRESADAAAACQWFRAAADQDHVSAQLALGTMYCLGRGVAQSEEQARTWFAKRVHSGGIAHGGPEAEIQRPALNDIWTRAKLDEVLPENETHSQHGIRFSLFSSGCHLPVRRRVHGTV